MFPFDICTMFNISAISISAHGDPLSVSAKYDLNPKVETPFQRIFGFREPNTPLADCVTPAGIFKVFRVCYEHFSYCIRSECSFMFHKSVKSVGTGCLK